MNFNFKFASIISVLAILLWFVFYAFNTSSDTSKFSSGEIAYNPQEHTSEGFAAFEDLKALQRAEKKAKEKKKTENKGKESNEKQGTPTVAKTQSTRLTASGFSSQQAPQLSPLEQIQLGRKSVAEQIRQTQASQTQASQTQALQTQTTKTPVTQTLVAQQSQLSATKPAPASNNVQAIEAILSVENSVNCQDNYVAAVFFRKNSASMRGKSLLSLDALIEEHRKCLNSEFLVKSTISDESTYMLDQRRRDEVKYYLLQRRVEKAAINLDQ